MSNMGHNLTGPGGSKLSEFVKRIEGLEEEKRTVAELIKDEYLTAKLAGFDVKTMRSLIRERRQDATKRDEQEALLDTYRRALGMLSDTPLGDAALRRANVHVLPPGA